jgi:transposase
MNCNQRHSRNLSPEECTVAVALSEKGRTQQSIAERFGVMQSTISRVINRYLETGINKRRTGKGRKRMTTANQDRFLRLQTLRQRFVTSTSLQEAFSLRYNALISQDTIRRRLAEHQLLPYVPATGPLLTAEHRLEFAHAHLNWQEADWARVLFTNESRFCRFSNDRRMRVYRRPGEPYVQCNIAQAVSYGGGSIMVWGGISLEGRTELVIVNQGRLTADRYVTTILEPHVVPYAPYIGENSILMNDNARPHTAQIVRQYFQEVIIVTMNWPARSADLNPIEHLWDNMGRSLKTLYPPALSFGDLGNHLTEIWNTIDQNDIRTLISSMGRRCEAVINARG